MKTVFKVGDKVFDARYGWGKIINIDYSKNYPICVDFETQYELKELYTIRGKETRNELLPSLSFTEYDFIKGGFSQERPEVLPNRGDIVWVRNNENEDWLCTQFMWKVDEYYRTTCWNPFNDDNGFHYIFLTTINPYKNEN